MDGPAAATSVDEAVRAMGYVIGKRAAAPDGSTVLIDLTGPIWRSLTVKVDGRARLVAASDEPPTTALRLPSTLFMRLCGGRRAALRQRRQCVAHHHGRSFCASGRAGAGGWDRAVP